jgi:hypothetical protein
MATTQNSVNIPAVAHKLVLGTGVGFTNVAVGSTGTVLIGNSAADPTFSSTPSVTSITISNAPVAGTDGTNKTYVDTAVSAVNPGTSVYAATTVNIPGTYLNGSSGIGATFVTTATGAFTLDGTTPPALSRILLKDQSTTFQNGVYVLTTNGSLGVGSTFTRAVDYDQPSDINSTGVIAVLNGTVNQLTGWLLNSVVVNVGADPITYIQYNSAPISVTQFDVLVGGASNTISSVGPGSSGQILQSGGSSANPSYSTATYPAISGTSGNVLTSDGTNWNSSTAPGGGLITITGTVTSAQIKTAHGTPVVLIAAQGAGKAINVVSSTLKYVYGGSNVFVAGATQQLQLYYGTATPIQLNVNITPSTIIPNSTIVGTTNFYFMGFSVLYVIVPTSIENLALTLYNQVTTEISGNAAGNNVINYSITYYVTSL